VLPNPQCFSPADDSAARNVVCITGHIDAAGRAIPRGARRRAEDPAVKANLAFFVLDDGQPLPPADLVGWRFEESP
jgi:hypothetical protein